MNMKYEYKKQGWNFCFLLIHSFCDSPVQQNGYSSFPVPENPNKE